MGVRVRAPAHRTAGLRTIRQPPHHVLGRRGQRPQPRSEPHLSGWLTRQGRRHRGGKAAPVPPGEAGTAVLVARRACPPARAVASCGVAAAPAAGGRARPCTRPSVGRGDTARSGPKGRVKKMAINKTHDEFRAVNMNAGWETPPGYPAGITQKILSGSLDETARSQQSCHQPPFRLS
jgi:hypothetical protein